MNLFYFSLNKKGSYQDAKKFIMNHINFDDVLKKIVGKEYKSNSFAAPIITVLLICYLRKNKKGSYQDAKKFIMNHINKCIYEKELEWNGIVNNKAWSRVLNKKRCVF